MKYNALFVIFEKKKCKFFNCRLVQIIGGAVQIVFYRAKFVNLAFSFTACFTITSLDYSVRTLVFLVGSLQW